ncbi:MAG: DUF5335 family protein [Candidatus Tectomicrobia bacterium]|uniref:DUF5335 family protein n=1 Tax=Tectimicrobiota bacterium TaxID=2528274 RepID=A0A932CN68_UNCTE|nr:DUF5335 family protein [Candidatus Tectomicrobia bacterium]
MWTREIPRNEWAQFFDNFSRRYRGWLVTVEVLGPDIGAQIEAHELPLEGITTEVKEDGEEIISILGKEPMAHITHTIAAPTHVRLKQAEEGIAEAVEIESASRTKILILLHSVSEATSLEPSRSTVPSVT